MIALPLSIDAVACVLAGSVCLRLPWPRARGRAAAAAMACSLAGLFVAVAAGTPTWTNGAAIAASVAAFCAIVEAVGPAPGPDRRDDDGGLRVTVQPPSPPPGGDGGAGSEPEWWPEFERELRTWAADRASRPRAPAQRG